MSPWASGHRDRLLHANYQEVETAYKEIAAYIYEAVGPEGNQISVGEILEATGHSSLLVNAVLDIWDNRVSRRVAIVGHRESETVIGSLPVLDRQALARWPDAPLEFIIPLSPHLSMAALAVPLREEGPDRLPVGHIDRDNTDLANFGQVGVDGTNKATSVSPTRPRPPS